MSTMLTTRRISVCLLLLVASGCADLQQGSGSRWAFQWPFTAAGTAAEHNGQRSAHTGRAGAGGYAQFSFDWLLSGDPQIMPLQVFDDGVNMWLQFPPDSAWPAVFEITEAGWRPVSHRSRGQYMIIDGIHGHLALRGGHLQGEIKRKPVASDAVRPATSPVEPPMTSPIEQASAAPTPARTPTPALTPTPAVVPGLSDMAHARGEDSVPGFLGAPIGRFAVSPADITMRQALERWARTAGWAFSAEHWDVDVDIPLVGEAGFDADFKSAVRDLLAATEMGDRPLQPCFYSNQVLRVVPYAQPCDRRIGMGTAQ